MTIASLLIISLFLQVTFLVPDSEAQCPPAVTPPSTFVASNRCPGGGTYQQANPRASCTCVNRCGYICTPVQGSPTVVPTTTIPTTLSTTTTPTTTTPCPSSCALSDFTTNSPNGTIQCSCQKSGNCSFYACLPTTTTAPTTPTTTTVAGSGTG